jgi:outer membrane protein assembly factor BamB
LSITLLALPAWAGGNPSFQPHPFDWPQWQGPERTAISRETGLLPSWPKEGPPLVWKAEGLGGGYSTPSVAAGRIFGMSYRGGKKDEVVWAVDEASGKELWSTRIADGTHVGYDQGSRCTPTVDGELIYVVGVGGDLVCLESATGTIRWRKNFKKDFEGRMMSGWGYSESPLVDGDKLVVTPGGAKATLVALHKKTGDVIWKAQVPPGETSKATPGQRNASGYSSVIVAEVDGHREYIQFLGRGVIGVDATDGRFLWAYDAPANKTANISTPIYHDHLVFAASAYDTGGGLAQLVRVGNEIKAEEKYFTKHMQNHHGGMILLDGYLYGADGGKLACLEFKTGKVMWAEGKAGKGSIAYADGRLYYRNEGGPMLLVEASPQKYIEHGRFQQPERSKQNAWPHPVIANGKLYLRDQDVLLCYDVKQR